MRAKGKQEDNDESKRKVTGERNERKQRRG